MQAKPLAEQITPLVQRQEDEEEEIQPKPIADKISPLIQRQEEEEEPVQAKGDNSSTAVATPGIESSINSLKGGGQPLSKSVRNYLESRFGYDFSGVRVHTDSKASETAKSINAKAFTKGRNIVFGAGQYSPETTEGKSLLGHELTHVVQQQAGINHSRHNISPVQAKFNIGRSSDIYTQEAERLEYIQTDGETSKVQQNLTQYKGGKPGPPFVVNISKKFIKDAGPLPVELRNKLKAYFLVTYEKSEFEKMYTKKGRLEISEKQSIQDEMEALKNMGYLVVYIEFATERDIISAFEDPNAVFIFTTGHGDPPGIIRTTNWEHVEPKEIKIPKGSKLKQVILENCHIKDQIDKWKKILPKNTEITAWEGKHKVKEAVEFNSGGSWSDRQWDSLMTRVKSLPVLKNEKGEIFKITGKGEKEVIINYEKGGRKIIGK